MVNDFKESPVVDIGFLLHRDKESIVITPRITHNQDGILYGSIYWIPASWAKVTRIKGEK